jgi:hypothetical protein
MKTKILTISKTFLILLISSFLLLSCNTKTERMEQIRIFYPKADIIDVTPRGVSGWRFIVNDTISKRCLFIECYADSDLEVVEFFINK